MTKIAQKSFQDLTISNNVGWHYIGFCKAISTLEMEERLFNKL